MKEVKYLVFRYLTSADFFNIYKPSGTEIGGGGQTYIDFPTVISIDDWKKFFKDAPNVSLSKRAKGFCWTIPINNVGLTESQQLTMYQRRLQSVAISSQRITSKKSNRVLSWHPDNGFPYPNDPVQRKSVPKNLAIYLVKTMDGEFWAGWFQGILPCDSEMTSGSLQPIFENAHGEGYSGFMNFAKEVLFIDESNLSKTFHIGKNRKGVIKVKTNISAKTEHIKIKRKCRKKKEVKKYVRKILTEDEITKKLLVEDQGIISCQESKVGKKIIRSIQIRNTKAVQNLKDLYQGKCQISGDKYIFIKKDGFPYCEAHHLMPLGNKGADSPYNIIIVSPLIHRMLHYADVLGLDLSKISHKNTLEIKINGQSYIIRWHPKHAALVKTRSKI